jgi:predicted DNA-binding protein YlxM (UPF0122 family)
MVNYTLEEYIIAKNEVEKTIRKCELILPKFKVGTSQYTLLVNRINALEFGRDLIDRKIMNKEIRKNDYSFKEIEQSLNPVKSIIHKCKKAQSKYEVGTTQYNRYISMIQTMSICESLIEYINHIEQ